MLLFKNTVIMTNIYLETVKMNKDSLCLNLARIFEHVLVEENIFSSAQKGKWTFHVITFNNKWGKLLNFKVSDDKITLYVR